MSFATYNQADCELLDRLSTLACEVAPDCDIRNKLQTAMAHPDTSERAELESVGLWYLGKEEHSADWRDNLISALIRTPSSASLVPVVAPDGELRREGWLIWTIY